MPVQPRKPKYVSDDEDSEDAFEKGSSSDDEDFDEDVEEEELPPIIESESESSADEEERKPKALAKAKPKVPSFNTTSKGKKTPQPINYNPGWISTKKPAPVQFVPKPKPLPSEDVVVSSDEEPLVKKPTKMAPVMEPSAMKPPLKKPDTFNPSRVAINLSKPNDSPSTTRLTSVNRGPPTSLSSTYNLFYSAGSPVKEKKQLHLAYDSSDEVVKSSDDEMFDLTSTSNRDTPSRKKAKTDKVEGDLDLDLDDFLSTPTEPLSRLSKSNSSQSSTSQNGNHPTDPTDPEISRNLNEMTDEQISSMDDQSLRSEIRGEGTGIEWSESTMKKMRKETMKRFQDRRRKEKEGNFERPSREQRSIQRSTITRQPRETEISTRTRSKISKIVPQEISSSSSEDEIQVEKRKRPIQLDNSDEEKEAEFSEEDSEDEPKQKKKKNKDRTIEEIISDCQEFSQRICKKLLEQDKMGKDGKKLVSSPTTLQHALKSYQVVALNWLYILYMEKLNGILADEMGLGKTIETIAFLALLQERDDAGPHLIVVPASTLSNWERECERWCPSLVVSTYYGNMDERMDLRDEILEEPPNIILTTYNIALQKKDRAFLKKFEFSYLILDEAQNIKNSESERYKGLKSLHTSHKLLLTGSPLQNNMEELWSLLYFLMPNMFGEESKKWFQKLKRCSDDEKQNYIDGMKSILAPFILRRLKSEVSLELPTKTEHTVECSMDSTQDKFYKEIFQKSRKMWKEMQKRKMENSNSKKKEKGEKEEPVKSVHNLLTNTLMEMRKMANHPLLCRNFYDSGVIEEMATIMFEEDDEGQKLKEIKEDLAINSDFELHNLCVTTPSLKKFALSQDKLLNSTGKFQQLQKMLPKLLKKDHRILIFSQMTRMLDIIEILLDHMKLKFLRLDGQTHVTERQEIIDDFSANKEVSIFLLSTKAGGVGINLTAADTVIFYDIAFNPSVDLQAEDRVHRLGQEKPVQVFKLITLETIEEHIFKMAASKKQFNDNMLEEGSFDLKTESSTKQILKLFKSVFDE